MRKADPIRTKAFSSKQLAVQAAVFADDTKAENIVLLDMRGLVNFCDYFVIATGTSDRHVRAVATAVEEGLEERGVQVHVGRSIKGISSADAPEGAWALLDTGDVVIHIFEPRAREFYSLEYLWQDAPRIEYKRPVRKPRKKT